MAMRTRAGPAAARSAPSAAPAEIVTEAAALSELAPEWQRLAELRGNAFVTPQWFHAFLGAYGDAALPYVAVSRRGDGSLRGLVPLTITESRPFQRRLMFAGANLGDRFHPVAAPEDEAAVAAATGVALAQRRREWGSLVLRHVEASSRWPQALVQADARVFATVWDDPSVLPYLVLPGTWEEFLASRSRNFRSELGRKLRGLERDHTVSFRQAADEAMLGRDLDCFFELHDRRWAARGGSSSATPRARDFHHDFAAAALREGWLRLWFLEVDGVPVATWYGWLLGRRYEYYLAGFAEDWARYSVGLLLLAHTVRDAIEEGAVEYDLLLGGEAYKDRFATSSRLVMNGVATRSLHPRHAAARLEVALRKAGRRLPEPARDRVRVAGKAMLRRLPGAVER